MGACVVFDVVVVRRYTFLMGIAVYFKTNLLKELETN